ncbi:MAG TPA: efflux transporter outer membrane subunit [Vicinamibacterales bacterium]
MNRRIVVVIGLIVSAGCATGPKYVRPVPPMPLAFAESGAWKPARPNDEAARGKWWEVFRDEPLNALEDRLDVSNNTLRAAQAQFNQARAMVRYAAASRSPQVSGTGAGSRTNHSENTPNWSATATEHYSDFLLRLDTSYELDVWGRVRASVAASRAAAQASAADLEVVRLSLHAELAADYFFVRALDSERELLQSSVAAYERALELTRNRYKGGVATAVDVAQAEAQLETTRAQLIDLQARRAQVEHAIATLLGQPPGSVKAPASPLTGEPPSVPPSLPADLLERRPDIAAAERRVAAANAQVGVAASAFYPMIALTANTGFESAALVELLRGVSGFWTAVPAAALTLLDGGRRRSVSDQAKAGYERAVALYRETTLSAFREVEDQLAILRVLDEEAIAQQAAVAASDRSLALSINRYKGGIATYLEVIVAQNTAFNNRRTAVSILARRLTASVLLIKALGGGWDASKLPAL